MTILSESGHNYIWNRTNDNLCGGGSNLVCAVKARPQHSGQGQGKCKKVTQDITQDITRGKGGHSSLGAGAGARTRVATAFTRGRGRDITQDITRDMKETP